MLVLGSGLAAFNTISARKDVSSATGPTSESQKEFFIAAADRPDIAVFFKNLTPDQRLKMAKQIGKYDDPKLPGLIVKLLSDFDTKARAELTRSLTRLAKSQPQSVADQLKERGGLQAIGVSAALDNLGDSAIPYVIKTLEVGDARPNAIEFLVRRGSVSIPSLLPLLDSNESDIRLAAADALGKLRVLEASTKLRRLYESAALADKTSYLTALSSIGDVRNEPIFTTLLQDQQEPLPNRSQSALGLGRIGNRSACATLWKFANAIESELSRAAIEGLQLAGEQSLSVAPTGHRSFFEVASKISSPKATELLNRALLKEPDVAEYCSNRPELVPALSAQLDRVQDGRVMDAIIRVLLSTPEGEAKLKVVAERNLEVSAMAARYGQTPNHFN
jgi:hypothetical protein